MITFPIILTALFGLVIIVYLGEDDLWAILIGSAIYITGSWLSYADPGATFPLVLNIIASTMAGYGVLTSKDSEAPVTVIVGAFGMCALWIPWAQY